MAGREPGFRMTEEHRVKIKNSNILNALVEHVEGQREMSATQVSAGLGLLKKVMPDLANVQHSGDAENPVAIVAQIVRKIVDPQSGNPDGSGVPPTP